MATLDLRSYARHVTPAELADSGLTPFPNLDRPVIREDYDDRALIIHRDEAILTVSGEETEVLRMKVSFPNSQAAIFFANSLPMNNPELLWAIGFSRTT